MRSTAGTGETNDLLQVPVHVAVGGPATAAAARAFAHATAYELGLSGSGEAWGRGVPPRHCSAREESIRGGRGAEDENGGALVKQGPCESHAIARRAHPRGEGCHAVWVASGVGPGHEK